MLKILLLGKNGQLGWELQRSLTLLGELIVLDRHNGGDLSNLTALQATIDHIKPQVIVNAAAYTAVDKAEQEIEQATNINTRAPALLARICETINALLIHYSTDYVFDGSGDTPWQENSPTNPLNHYGYSKLQGEQAIIHSGCNYLIFRTSWVYAAKGHNFIKTIHRLASQQTTLNMIADQMGAPTSAELLADITAYAIRQTLTEKHVCGLYHIAPKGETSWYAYAQFIIDALRTAQQHLTVQHVLPIMSNDYVTPAKRPLNSRLNTTKFAQDFAVHFPEWQTGVLRVIQEIAR